jgi:hypothetical protein
MKSLREQVRKTPYMIHTVVDGKHWHYVAVGRQAAVDAVNKEKSLGNKAFAKRLAMREYYG